MYLGPKQTFLIKLYLLTQQSKTLYNCRLHWAEFTHIKHMVLDQWIDLTNWAARWVCFNLSVVTLKSFVCSEHLHSWRFCLNLYHWLILISIARWTARCYFLKVKLIFHIMSIVKRLKWWVGKILFTGIPRFPQIQFLQFSI